MVVSQIMRTERGNAPQTSYPRYQRTCKVIVVGIGGAGGNIIKEMQSTGALADLQVALKWIHLDTGLWRHRCGVAQIRVPMVTLSLARLSTGGRADIGRAVAWKHRHLLLSLLADTDIVIVLAGTGGGSGGGAAPVVTRLARDVGALTIAAVTMPFNFEGNRGQKAATSIKRLRRDTDYLLTFSNQQLGAEFGDNTLMTTIYEVQAQRIAYSLRDLLANLRFD
jgi:cell division protein FtsZ